MFRVIAFINSLYYNLQVAYSPVNEDIKRAFEDIVGENNVSSAMAVREQHGKDESHHKCHPADLVVWPTNKEQVCQVAKLCNDHCLPLIPFGSGTGLEGGVVGIHHPKLSVQKTCKDLNKVLPKTFFLAVNLRESYIFCRVVLVWM